MDEIDLIPCPICGDAPKVRVRETDFPYFQYVRVGCVKTFKDSPKGAHEVSAFGATEEEAINLWSTLNKTEA